MMRCTCNDLALELRLAIELLIVEPTPDAYNQLSKTLLAMGNSGARGVSLVRAGSMGYRVHGLPGQCALHSIC